MTSITLMHLFRICTVPGNACGQTLSDIMFIVYVCERTDFPHRFHLVPFTVSPSLIHQPLTLKTNQSLTLLLLLIRLSVTIVTHNPFNFTLAEWFFAPNFLPTVRFRILKFTIFVPFLGGVVQDKNPYKCSDISRV